MLKNTFIHIQRIGAITEQRLWESGLRNWDSFSGDPPIPAGRKHFLLKGIDESKRHLADHNPIYFSKQLPSNQCWRLFPEFRDSTVYLDIETTGLDRYFNHITTIALYDGESIQTYVKGQNLDDFIENIQKFKVIVSYNGKSFDIPFLENYFKIRLNHARWASANSEHFFEYSLRVAPNPAVGCVSTRDSFAIRRKFIASGFDDFRFIFKSNSSTASSA